MNRVDKIISYLMNYINEDNYSQTHHIYQVHMYGVSQFASMIALKRNLDSEVAAIAGLLHDIHALETLDTHKHAHKGAKRARKILDKLNVTTDKETDIICDAIYNHSDKMHIHGEYDEALKDADVLQHCLYNTSLPLLAKDAERFSKLLDEFGLANPKK